jgi:hypothetical protein
MLSLFLLCERDEPSMVGAEDSLAEANMIVMVRSDMKLSIKAFYAKMRKVQTRHEQQQRQQKTNMYK